MAMAIGIGAGVSTPASCCTFYYGLAGTERIKSVLGFYAFVIYLTICYITYCFVISLTILLYYLQFQVEGLVRVAYESGAMLGIA